MPVSAKLVLPAGTWSCTFDQTLYVQPITPTNWKLFKGNQRYPAVGTSVSGSKIIGTVGSPTFWPAAPHIDYTPPPFDVLNLGLVPAAAFTDFPLS